MPTTAQPKKKPGARSRPRRPVFETEKSLKKSLKSTNEGLKQFLNSMKKSGMHEGLAGYQQMQAVLVQQRLWAESHQRRQLIPEFRTLAKTAQDLHRIFAGYANVMKSLSELDKLTAMKVEHTHSRPVRPRTAAKGT